MTIHIGSVFEVVQAEPNSQFEFVSGAIHITNRFCAGKAGVFNRIVAMTTGLGEAHLGKKSHSLLPQTS